MSQKPRHRESSCYLTELSMVQDLSGLITSEGGPIHCRKISFEFDYNSGRTDIVGIGPEDALHAFETKLTNWREALEQARRNYCYAHYCYVALPERTAELALKAKEKFEKYGIGLVILTGQNARLAITPRRNSPLLPWLTKEALSLFSSLQEWTETEDDPKTRAHGNC